MPRFGCYELLSLIGRDGMAEVYRVRILEGVGAGDEVALKCLLPDALGDGEQARLFVGEAALGQWLHHPNIVRVFESGELDNTFFLAMELVDGRDLHTILETSRRHGMVLPIDCGTYLVTVLLEALAFAHCLFTPDGKLLRLVHCDVSPSNLFVSRLGDLKLGDFGIARARADGGGGARYGKAAYLPPEVLAGEPTSPLADLWGAAVTLYELYTNGLPFDGPNQNTIARQALAGPPDVREGRPDVPDAIADALMTALHPDPAARFGTAELFAEALEPHLDRGVGTPLAIAAVVRGLFNG